MGLQWPSFIPLNGNSAVEITYTIGDAGAAQPIGPVTIDPDVIFYEGFDPDTTPPCRGNK